MSETAVHGMRPNPGVPRLNTAGLNPSQPALVARDVRQRSGPEEAEFQGGMPNAGVKIGRSNSMNNETAPAPIEFSDQQGKGNPLELISEVDKEPSSVPSAIASPPPNKSSKSSSSKSLNPNPEGVGRHNTVPLPSNSPPHGNQPLPHHHPRPPEDQRRDSSGHASGLPPKAPVVKRPSPIDVSRASPPSRDQRQGSRQGSNSVPHSAQPMIKSPSLPDLAMPPNGHNGQEMTHALSEPASPRSHVPAGKQPSGGSAPNETVKHSNDHNRRLSVPLAPKIQRQNSTKKNKKIEEIRAKIAEENKKLSDKSLVGKDNPSKRAKMLQSGKEKSSLDTAITKKPAPPSNGLDPRTNNANSELATTSPSKPSDQVSVKSSVSDGKSKERGTISSDHSTHDNASVEQPGRKHSDGSALIVDALDPSGKLKQQAGREHEDHLEHPQGDDDHAGTVASDNDSDPHILLDSPPDGSASRVLPYQAGPEKGVEPPPTEGHMVKSNSDYSPPNNTHHRNLNQSELVPNAAGNGSMIPRSRDDGNSSEVPSLHTEEESKEDTLNMARVKKCVREMNIKLKKARQKAVADYNNRLEEIGEMLDSMLESEKGKGAKTEQSVNNILSHFENHVKELNQNAKVFAENHIEWNLSADALRGQGTPLPQPPARQSPPKEPAPRTGASSTFSQDDAYSGPREALEMKGPSQG